MISMEYLTLQGVIGVVACVAVRWTTAPRMKAGNRASARDRMRRLRGIGWGAALLPAALLGFGVFGLFALCYQGFQDLWDITTPGGAFLVATVVVLCVAVGTALLPRGAAYLAAVGLDVFGLLEVFIGTGYSKWTNGYASTGWFLHQTSSTAVWLVGMASLAAGIALTRHTIVSDARAHRIGLSAMVTRLNLTRAEAVDSAAAELRRLERDLHDGAQARLVSLGINLRAAEKLVRTSPDAAEALIIECREASSRALAELRDLVRGVYPPVLADRGLADAVRALALDCPIPVPTVISLNGRPPLPVESAVYFAVAEILNNVARHADASSAIVSMEHESGMLRVEVTDDGAGGANPDNGTGLKGIERRLSAFDGILAVSSPVGGPTIVIIEVPCTLSSPKTSFS